MIRFVAYLCIITASYVVSSAICKKLEREIYLQIAMIELITTIKRSVLLYNASPHLIASSFEHALFSEIGFTALVKEKGFSDAIQIYARDFGYSQYSERALHNFLSDLGNLSLTEQIAFCEEMLASLQKELDGKRDEYPKKKKLYLTLGICAGLCVVIILI